MHYPKTNVQFPISNMYNSISSMPFSNFQYPICNFQYPYGYWISNVMQCKNIGKHWCLVQEWLVCLSEYYLPTRGPTSGDEEECCLGRRWEWRLFRDLEDHHQYELLVPIRIPSPEIRVVQWTGFVFLTLPTQSSHYTLFAAVHLKPEHPEIIR